MSVCLSFCMFLSVLQCLSVCLHVSDWRSRLYLLLTMSLYTSYSVCIYALQAVFLLFLSLIHLVNNSKHESVSRTYITQSFILGTKDSVFYPVYQTNSAFRNQSFLGQRQLYSHGHAALIFLVRMQINFFSISFIHIYIWVALQSSKVTLLFVTQTEANNVTKNNTETNKEFKSYLLSYFFFSLQVETSRCNLQHKTIYSVEI